MAVTVFIADDQAMVRQGFRALLDAEPDLRVVGDAENGKAAVAGVVRSRPHVVLMDIRMPVMNGLEAAAEIIRRRIDPPPKLLMLTTFDVDDYVYEALSIGASGFMLKDAPAEELTRAVRWSRSRRPTPSWRLRSRGGSSRRRPGTACHLPGPRASWPASPPGEREVLELVARGMSNAEIAGQLMVAEQTVKTHVGKVLAKLHLRDRAQAVVLAYESGLVRPR